MRMCPAIRVTGRGVLALSVVSLLACGGEDNASPLAGNGSSGPGGAGGNASLTAPIGAGAASGSAGVQGAVATSGGAASGTSGGSASGAAGSTVDTAGSGSNAAGSSGTAGSGDAGSTAAGSSGAGSGGGGGAGVGGDSGTGGSGGSGGTGGSGGMDSEPPLMDSGPKPCRAEPAHMGGLTQYDQTALGNCGMPWPSDDLYAAIATADYMSSAVCGMCLEVTGPTGQKAIVHAVDQCPIASNPKCTAGHLDLSHTAYRAVVPGNFPTGGEVPNSQPVSWRYVPCEANGPIVYHFKDGTHMNWLAVQIRNSRYGIAKLRFRNSGAGAWRELAARTVDLAYFVADKPGTTKYDFEVTDVNGQVLYDTGVELVANGDVPGHAQFPSCE